MSAPTHLEIGGNNLTTTVDICRQVWHVSALVDQVSVPISTVHDFWYGSLSVRPEIVILMGTQVRQRYGGCKISLRWTVVSTNIA